MLCRAHADADLFAEGLAFDEGSDSDVAADGPVDGIRLVDAGAGLVFAHREFDLLLEGYSDVSLVGPGSRLRKDQQRHEIGRGSDRALRRKCERAERRIESLEGQLVDYRKKGQFATRKKGGHLSQQRGFDIGFRQACGWTSLRTVSIWCGDLHLDRDTIRNWEIKTSTAVLASSGSFHVEHEMELLKDPGNDSLNHSCFSIRGDATNNVKGEQFHVLHVESLYNIGGERDYNSIWPEPVEVYGSANSAKAWSLYIRQLEQVCCPAFELIDRLEECRHRVLRSVLASADAGSDQKGFQDIADNFLSGRPKVLWYHVDCLKHHSSNGTRTSIKLADVFSKRWTMPHGLYSAVVKFYHFFVGGKLALQVIWANNFGWDAADGALKSVLPRPIANRWGSFDSCSDRLLGFVFEELILVSVTASDPNPKTNKRKRKSSEPENELAVDELEHFRQKKGRWTTETNISIKQPAFWLLLRVSTVTRRPWVHLLNFLQDEHPKLKQLICTKHQQIAREFEDNLRLDEPWEGLFDKLDHPLLTGGACPGLLAANEAIVSFSSCHATDFHRRVTKRIDCWPLLVVWFAFSGKDVVCEERQWRAAQFLDCRPQDPTSKKLLINFGAEIGEVAATGTCPDALYQYSQDIGISFWPDSGEVESTNKIVTLAFSRCTTKSKQLVKATVVNKKKVFESARTEREAAATIPALVEASVESTQRPQYAALRDDPDRWSVETKLPPQTSLVRAGAAADLDRLIPLADADATPRAAGAPPGHLEVDQFLDKDDVEWASTWTVTWFRTFTSLCQDCFPTSANLFVFRKPRARSYHDGEAWLCGTTHFFVGQCLRLNSTSPTDLAIDIPFKIWNTIEILARMRFHVAAAPMVCEILDVDWPTRTTCRILRKRKLFDLQEVHPSAVRIKAYLGAKSKASKAAAAKKGSKSSPGPAAAPAAAASPPADIMGVADMLGALGKHGDDAGGCADFDADGAMGGDDVIGALEKILEEAGFASDHEDAGLEEPI